MKGIIIKGIKVVTALTLTAVMVIGTNQSVYADAAGDALAAQQAQQAQLLLLMQTPEYQAALVAQQKALAEQQKALEQYQAALMAQYQAALQKQYEAAVLAFTNAQYLQASAVNQTYLLNAAQALQKAQYEALINKQGLDYKNYLMEQFKNGQYGAIQSFKGYNGIQ